MRKALIAAGALALALTVGACGDNEGGTPTGDNGQSQNTGQSGVFNDAQSLINAAKEGTAKAKTSKFTMDMTMGSMLSMKADGEAEYAGENTKMAMNMTMNMNIPGAGSSVPKDLKMEMVMVDKTVYIKMPEGMPGADASKPWMKMPIDQLEGGQGAQFSQSMEFSDPAKTLEMIKENGKINATEQTEVDGQPATKYSVELDFAKLAQKMGQQMPQGMNIDSVPMDVYLNADNLPVQIEMNLGKIMKDVASQSGQQLPEGMDQAKMVAKYTDWGAPVNIQAPPQDQVSDSMPGMGGMGSTPPSTPN